MTDILPIEVGDILRDTYYDRKNPKFAKRTVKVLAVFQDCARVEVVTDVQGNPPKGKARQTEVSFKTLRSGYERVRSDGCGEELPRAELASRIK
jgi:hypothetical protein